jgi:hypothetical protein
LAVIEPDAATGSAVPPTMDATRDFLRDLGLGVSDDFNIIVTGRTRSSLPATLGSNSYVVCAGDDAIPANGTT